MLVEIFGGKSGDLRLPSSVLIGRGVERRKGGVAKASRLLSMKTVRGLVGDGFRYHSTGNQKLRGQGTRVVVA